MNGKYIKEVHACNLPERKPQHGMGTVWECDCDRIYMLTYYPAIYNIPSSSGWRKINKAQWDANTLREIPIIYNYPEPKKKWWRK